MTEEGRILRRRPLERLRSIREKGVLGTLLDKDVSERRQKMFLDGFVFGVTNRVSEAVQERTMSALERLRESSKRFTQRAKRPEE